MNRSCADAPMNRASSLLTGALVVIVLLTAGLVHHGNAHLNPPAAAAAAHPGPAHHPSGPASWADRLGEPLPRLLVQLLLIVTATRVTGMAFRKMGQPAVVGEMAAGFLIGPSLLGSILPGAFHFIFPPGELGTLRLLAQVGVCLFMFTVGMEFDLDHLKGRTRATLMVSQAGIILPYFLGVLLAFFLYPSHAVPGSAFAPFALFMGIAMSVTAFPVLARILQDRGLTRTPLGGAALTCAAVNDVMAWSILALVVAVVHAAGVGSALATLALTLAFVAFMLGVVRPGLPRWFGAARLDHPEPGRPLLAAVLGLAMASSLATELIGIHALFGAFVAGVVMPEAGGFRHQLALRIESFASVLLLPLFFAFVGLQTRIGLLAGPGGWWPCLLIVIVATLGKLGGSAATSRLMGMGWRESLQLGALMNTRGLMELIVLNMGRELGILSDQVFAMLVVMALVTTVMTGPLLAWFGAAKAGPARSAGPPAA